MALDLNRAELEGALAALGALCRDDTTVLLGGSAALILTNALRRGTNDGDVIASRPDLGQLQTAIRAVAHDRGLPDGWLNGSVQSYLEVSHRTTRHASNPSAASAASPYRSSVAAT